MSDDMTSSSTSYSTGDGSYYDPIYETTTYSTTETTVFEAPAAYEGSTYTPSSFEPVADTSFNYDQSYSTTPDWGVVSDFSQEFHNQYLADAEMSNMFWDMSTDATIAGDSYLAYELNQLSLGYESLSDANWAASNQVWDASSWTPVTDTSWTASADTSWTASSYDPVADA